MRFSIFFCKIEVWDYYQILYIFSIYLLAYFSFAFQDIHVNYDFMEQNRSLNWYWTQYQ